MKNAYIDDGITWLAKSAVLVEARGMFEDKLGNVADATLFFALGVEKLLKGLLWDINPLFVFKSTTVENICGVLYWQRMVKGARNKFRDSAKAGRIDSDVIASTATLTAAQLSRKAIQARWDAAPKKKAAVPKKASPAKRKPKA